MAGRPVTKTELRPLEKFREAMSGMLQREFGAQITLCEAIANLSRRCDELQAKLGVRDLAIRDLGERVRELERRLGAFTRQGGWVQ